MELKSNVVELRPELTDEQLTDAAGAIGLAPVKAFVRKERSKGAERQARYRERKEAQGVQQMTLTADQQLLEAVKHVQAAVAAGKPVHVALIEEAARKAPEGPQAPPTKGRWQLRAEALQLRIDSHNALAWWRRILTRV